MPAETDRHERTLMAWPTVAMAEIGLWGDAGLDGARDVYAEIARVIAAHEPLTVIAAPDDDEDARRRCGDEVEVVRMRIDDSWIRDNGPVTVLADDGTRHAMHFRFNAWGGKFPDWKADEGAGGAIARRLGLPVHEVPMVLEGGSIAVDGAGTLVTTEMTLRSEEAVAVPSSAVQVSQTGKFVFVIKDGVAKVQHVTVERQVGSESVVTSGLNGGETVVTDGQLLLSNGTRVETRPPKVAGS